MKKFASWFFANIDRFIYVYCTLVLSCYLVSLGAKASLIGVFISLVLAFIYTYVVSSGKRN